MKKVLFFAIVAFAAASCTISEDSGYNHTSSMLQSVSEDLCSRSLTSPLASLLDVPDSVKCVEGYKDTLLTSENALSVVKADGLMVWTMTTLSNFGAAQFTSTFTRGKEFTLGLYEWSGTTSGKYVEETGYEASFASAGNMLYTWSKSTNSYYYNYTVEYKLVKTGTFQIFTYLSSTGERLDYCYLTFDKDERTAKTSL